jgi:starch synthase
MDHSQNHPLRVLFLTAEFDPYAKVGGLGDYSGSLPRSIKVLGAAQNRPVDIRVAIPYHGQFHPQLPQYKKSADITVDIGNEEAHGSAYEFIHEKVPLYLIRRSGKAAGYRAIYNRTQLDDARKFVFYSLAIADLVKKLGWMPDVVHANDWHTALSLHYFAGLRKKNQLFRSIKLLQVIHNMPYLGEGSRGVMKKFGIRPVKSDLIPEWAKFLPLPMGLVSADWIATVSPSYAEELTTKEFSSGLAEFFLANRDKTTGILNGIDTTIWDPEFDPLIPSQFSAANLENRQANKEAVLNDLGLRIDGRKPLLVFISRLTPQKGVDIILKSLPKLLDLDWNAVILGCGDKDLETGLSSFEAAHPDRFRAVLEFNNAMAHKLYAAGDILLMPSRYEPCGLSQMIAMRYGCIPVASAVGGLKDSILPADQSNGTGYLFEGSDENSLIPCLRKALLDYQNEKKWSQMQQRAMDKDFSWTRSAGQYIDLYSQLSRTFQELKTA